MLRVMAMAVLRGEVASEENGTRNHNGGDAAPLDHLSCLRREQRR